MNEGLTDGEIEDRLTAATDQRWQDLWDAVAALAAEPEKGRWAGGEMIEGDRGPVLQMPYVVYSPAALDVVAKIGGLGANQPFDWQAWGGLTRYPGGRGLEAAPVAEAIRMVTAIVRADRFSEGTLLASLEGGTFMAAVDRLRRWYDEERSSPGR